MSAVCVALGALGGLGAALCRTRAPCRGHLWDLLLMRWESVNLVTSSTAPAAGRLYFDSLIYIYNMYIHVMYLYVVCLCYMLTGYIYIYYIM